MLLRGTAGAINVFIFPAEGLLGFSLHKIDETVYNPLLVIESSWKEDELIWHIDGTAVTRQQIPLLAKELFGDLIRVASGQMDETELFAHPLHDMSLGQNLAIGYKTQVIEQPIIPTSGFTNAAPPPAVAPTKPSFNLTSIDLAKKMLPTIDADISLLFQKGKTH